MNANQNANTVFSGSLVDGPNRAVALTVSGSGSLTLDGINSYSGGTTVPNGTLILDGAASLLAGTSLTIGSASPEKCRLPAGPLASFADRHRLSTLPPVPEPGTIVLLLAAAFMGCVALRKNRKRISS